MIQRARLLAAASQVACEYGAANVTVALIVEHAGVSRRTFYDIFSDGRECLLAALQDGLERARIHTTVSWQAAGTWRERLRNTVIALLGLFDEEPLLAQLLLVESLGMGRQVLAYRAEVLGDLIDVVHQAGTADRMGSDVGRLAAEGAIGGALGVLHARLTQTSPDGLVELAGPLTAMIVAPYHGAAAARRELERPTPPAVARRAGGDRTTPPLSNPFKDAGLRLTYRTMRVLEEVADRPGSSNREIGKLAGITDQGQTSKLLARLERLGLIVNKTVSQGKGEANAWTLTAAGRNVTGSLSGRATKRVIGGPR